MEKDVELIRALLEILVEQRKEITAQRAEIRRLEFILIEDYGWQRVDMS